MPSSHKLPAKSMMQGFLAAKPDLIAATALEQLLSPTSRRNCQHAHHPTSAYAKNAQFLSGN
jgi:hypothetical protein